LQGRFLRIGGIPILGLREPQWLVRVPLEFQVVSSKSNVAPCRLLSQLDQALRREEFRKPDIPLSPHRNYRALTSDAEQI
jgi:hypothetical protein